jgi:hypothetical protein
MRILSATVCSSFALWLVACSAPVEEDVTAKSLAQTLAKGTLRSVHTPLFWSGRVGPEDAPTGGEPPECQSVACDHFTLDINLPRGTFASPQRTGGVQVAIRWFGPETGPHASVPGVPPCCGEFDTLHLYVYKDGKRVAASEGIIATAQSTLIPAAENGTYTVWIAYDPTYNLNPVVEYEALAEVEFAPRVAPRRALLPDLEFRGTRVVTFDTPSFPLFEVDPPAGESCFNSERAEEGAKNCLRFDQVVANRGSGAAELRFAIPKDPSDTRKNVAQRVYASDGSWSDRDGGEYEFHDTHQHYHYTSFAVTNLWAADRFGRKLGRAPVRTSRKVSFCIVDIEIDAWGKKGDGSRKYSAPNCLFPETGDANFDYLVQGLTAGWSDIYEWYLPDQYIEVSGVKNGYYILEFCADPDNSIQETDESNNCSSSLIRLSNMGTPKQSAQNLGELQNGYCAR